MKILVTNERSYEMKCKAMYMNIATSMNVWIKALIGA